MNFTPLLLLLSNNITNPISNELIHKVFLSNEKFYLASKYYAQLDMDSSSDPQYNN